VHVTKNLLAEYVKVVEAAGFGGEEAAKEEARMEAATALIDGIDAEVVQLDEVAEMLEQHPRVAEALEARAKKCVAEREEQWRRESAEAHRTAGERLASVEQEIDRANSELSAVRASLERAIDEVVQTPLDSLARHGVVDALQGLLSSARRSISTTDVSDSTSTTPKPDVDTITDSGDLKKAVSASARASGVDLITSQYALGAVLAHPVTLFSGVNADRLAVDIASTLAGCNALRVSVGTAVFGLGDLMCSPVVPLAVTRLDGARNLGEFVSTGARDDVTVVILAGCNRAPPEVVLGDLLPALLGAPQRIAWSGRDGVAVVATLPSRLRIIGTLYSGDATYRVPTEISRRVGLVCADHRERDVAPVLPPRSPAPTRLEPGTWDVLCSGQSPDDLWERVVWLMDKGVGLPPDALTRVLTTYRRLLGDSQKVMTAPFASLLLGRGPSPDLTGLPGSDANVVREGLEGLEQSAAWRESWRHFMSGEDR
jgi:hypothetical protein